MCRPQGESLKSVNGFSLLEVMVAASLSVILISSLTKIYFSMLKTYESQYAINFHIMAAKSMFSVIGGDVRAAGYVGCSTLSREFKVEPYSIYSLTVDNALLINKGDMFTRYQQFPGSTLIEDMDSDSRIVTDLGTEFYYGQILVVSDCRHAEIFRVIDVNRHDGVQELVAEQPFRHSYHKYAEVGEFVVNRYFISMSENADSFSLFREDVYGEISEIVEGVAQLEFEMDRKGVIYRFMTSGKGGTYRWEGYAAGGMVGA